MMYAAEVGDGDVDGTAADVHDDGVRCGRRGGTAAHARVSHAVADQYDVIGGNDDGRVGGDGDMCDGDESDVDDDDGLFDPKFLSHDIDRDRDVVEDAEPFASVSIGVVRSA